MAMSLFVSGYACDINTIEFEQVEGTYVFMCILMLKT